MVKIFVGNIAEGVTDGELRVLFEKYGKVSECDVLGSYGFVHMETEVESEAAISNLDKTLVGGQAINVEKSKGGGGMRGSRSSLRLGNSGGGNSSYHGGFASGDYGSKAARRAGCTKLHIANLPDCVQSAELRELFERYGFVAECDVVEDRKIAFVHIEDSASDAAIQGLNGWSFKGMSLKVQLSKNQCKPSGSNNSNLYNNQYSNMYNSNNPSNSSSPGLIPTIQGRGIPVRTARVPMSIPHYSGHDNMSRNPNYGLPPAPAPEHNRYGPMGYNSMPNLNRESYTEHNLPPPARDRIELLDLLDRRRRLEALDPYERRLVACVDCYNLPPPPPEFLRLLRERALVKVRLPLPPGPGSVSRTNLQAATASVNNAVMGGVPSYTNSKISAPPVPYTGMYSQRNGPSY